MSNPPIQNRHLPDTRKRAARMSPPQTPQHISKVLPPSWLPDDWEKTHPLKAPESEVDYMKRVWEQRAKDGTVDEHVSPTAPNAETTITSSPDDEDDPVERFIASWFRANPAGRNAYRMWCDGQRDDLQIPELRSFPPLPSMMQWARDELEDILLSGNWPTDAPDTPTEPDDEWERVAGELAPLQIVSIDHVPGLVPAIGVMAYDTSYDVHMPKVEIIEASGLVRTLYGDDIALARQRREQRKEAVAEAAA